MKILFINYQPLAKTVYYRPGCFSRELVRRGHDVTVVTTSDNSRRGITEYDENGVRYVLMPDALWGRLRTGWDVWNLAHRLFYLRHQSFDLIHAFETRPATIHPVQYLLRKKPTPLVIDWIDWWGRGGLVRENRPAWYPYVFGWVETFYEEHYRTLADGTTVISHALGERAESLGVDPKTIFWIPNGAPVDLFQVLPPKQHRRDYGLPEDAFIIADSALDVLLGMDIPMKALRKVVESHPDVFLLMTGNRQKELRKLAEKIGVGEHFIHLGSLPYTEVPKALSCADVFVMSYPDRIANRGRWPGRIGTFLAMGRPVISNPVGEVKMLLEQEAVGLLAAEDPEDMARKIVQLKDDSNLRLEMGARARALAEKMTWSSMTDRLETCYEATVRRFMSRQSTAAAAGSAG